MNVISDIAGQYDTLRALLKRMPQGKVLSVGDMVDRGPKSREVVEWFMEHDHCFALYGNHEDMMVDNVFLEGRYQGGIWQMNGGKATIQSFSDEEKLVKAAEWFRTLPLSWENDNFLVSHSANPYDPWSREKPMIRMGPTEDGFYTQKFHIFGHNSFMGLKIFPSEWAMCIDTSASKQLCGVNLETMQVYVQEYV